MHVWFGVKKIYQLSCWSLFIGSPYSFDIFPVSIGVSLSFHPNIPISVRRLMMMMMYLCWEILILLFDLVALIPKKYYISLEFLTSNSVVKVFFSLPISSMLSLVRIISSIQISKIVFSSISSVLKKHCVFISLLVLLLSLL